MMYSKETVLINSYNELNDCLTDLLKYEMDAIGIDGCTIRLLNRMIDITLIMIDCIDKFEWSDVMKVRQSNYAAIRLVNTLLINQYDKILSHKQ